MVAAWNVSGKPKMAVDQAADQAKLDPEMVDRWVKFLNKKQTFYPYLHDWQMMVAAGGTADQAKMLAETFQDKIFDVYDKHKEIEKENEEITKKAGFTKKTLRRPNKPDQFETYDQFCPGCTLGVEDHGDQRRQSLQRSLRPQSLCSEDGGAGGRRGDPALFSFSGWSLTRRLSVQEQAYMDAWPLA